MILKGSRYENSRQFDPPEEGGEAFQGIRAREIGDAEGVIEHEIQAGDRLDLLARHYYNDSRLWWRIVDANPHFVFGDDLIGEGREGEQLLIPKARD